MIKKVGIIGFGNMAEKWHLKWISDLQDMFKVTDVYDLSKERMKKAQELCGAIIHSTVEDFLKADLDLVLVATPTYAHCEMALRAMEAGKNVVVEKPMAMNTLEVDSMIEMAKKKGIMLSIHQNRRWDPDYLTVKRLIQDEVIGKPFVIESRVMDYRNPAGVGVKEFYPDWRLEQKYGGGRLNEWGVHYIDQILDMVDSEVESVWADLKNLIWSSEVDTYGKCIAKFKNGLTFHVETSWVSMDRLPRWYCLGEKGSLVKDTDSEDKIRVRTLMAGKPAEAVVDVLKAPDNPFYRNIYDVLSHKAELIVKPEQVRDVIRVVDAARKSSSEGIVVYL